jgi:hypothetical protein
MTDVRAELHELSQRLAGERAALVAVGASAEELGELDAVIGDVKAAETAIVVRALERGAEIERGKRREAKIVECRSALDRVNELTRKLEGAEANLVAADNSLVAGENAVTRARDARPHPDSYPSAKETGAWLALVAKAEKDRDEKLAVRREAVGLRDRLSVERLNAQKRLGQLQFEERMLRAPAPQQEKGVGSLSAVR